MTLDDIKAIRAEALRVGYIALMDSVAETMRELLGAFPESVKVIILTDYSKAVEAPTADDRQRNDPTYQPSAAGPKSTVQALQARMVELQAKMDALTAAQRTLNP